MKDLNKKDIELLKKLCAIQSSRSSDSEINGFIEKELKKISGVSVHKDKFGNIYATKGKGENGFKAIVSHTDTVHSHYEERVVSELLGSIVAFAKIKTTLNYISHSVEQVGVGGDDKAGVFKCIKAMQDFDDIKSVYFRFEESGCLGSREADMSFFEDCNFVLQSDRRGNSDFITHTNGIKTSSAEFDESMAPILKKFGFKPATGSSTDVGQLKHNGLKVSCANISSGYYNAHTSSETINIADLTKTYNLICEIFTEKGNTRFFHEKEKQTTFSAANLFTAAKSLFSFSLGENYFSNTLEESANQCQFVKIPGTKAYRLILDKTIKVSGHKCLTCGSREGISFFPEDAVMYCDSETHSDIIDDWGIYETLHAKAGDDTYVYDRANDLWYNSKDAIYYDLEDRYVLREVLTY